MNTNNKNQKYSMKSDSDAARLLMRIGNHLDDISFSLMNSRLVMRVGIDDARIVLWRREQYRKKRTIKYLQDKQLIKIKKTGDEYETTLTDKGLLEFIRLQILSADILTDDEVTMVIFDIPEKTAHVRKQLRRFLENACFMPIQKSVWISQYDVGTLLVELFNVKGNKQWIQVFKAKRQ